MNWDLIPIVFITFKLLERTFAVRTADHFLARTKFLHIRAGWVSAAR
jgi:hypothetical protein